ncbi:MAG: universal stress protein [Xanthobacteraceae bacterium]|nr:universal stress protein [Xanthobacteraceae bacterium]
MIRDIVASLSVGKPREIVGEFAVTAARLFDAHLTAVAFANEPPVTSMSDWVNHEIIGKYRAEQKASAERAEKTTLDLARSAGIDCTTRILKHAVADAAKVFGAMARDYDLSVVAQGEPGDDVAETLMIEAALFESGRPVLVVPYIQKTGLKLDRVMVCWDGSRNAARAVGDALPFLRMAAHVDVVTVEQAERRNELKGAQIAEHLARHKLPVELKPLVAPDAEVANVILSHAADNDADLIVMGGYGHSRFREFILGGATRGMLQSMTVPVLMSH